MADDDNIKLWYSLRVKSIHEKASAYDLLRQNGVKFKHTGDREEQISCPFHGKDEKPSARIFPAKPQSPAHVWCYVCRERWDIIALWKKYHGSEQGFHRTLSEIEKRYGLETPTVPAGAFKMPVSHDDKQHEEFDRILQACEDRLRGSRGDYLKLGDMKGYLVAGSVLDKALFQVNEGALSPPEGIALLNRLIQKIGERIRSVPSG